MGISQAFEGKGGSYRIMGLDALERNMKRLTESRLETIIHDAIQEAAIPMLDRVRSLAPEKSGDLKRAIRIVGGSKNGRGLLPDRHR